MEDIALAYFFVSILIGTLMAILTHDYGTGRAQFLWDIAEHSAYWPLYVVALALDLAERLWRK